MSLTVNPDFGQVEADPSEVNLTAFESYFQEKRPFFVESQNITSYSLGLGEGSSGNDNRFIHAGRPQSEIAIFTRQR